MNPATNALFFLITFVFNLYAWVVILRILLQWVRADYFNPLSQFVIKLTDIPLKPLKKMIPMRGKVDYAAIVLFVVVELVKIILIGLLFGFITKPAGFALVLLADSIRQVVNFYFYLIIIVIISSWLTQLHYNPVMNLLRSVAEPVLSRARRLIPPIGGFDLSPILIILALKMVDILVVLPLLHLGGF